MLKQLRAHRWICFVHGGLTLLLGLGMVVLRPLMDDRLLGTFITVLVLLSTGFVLITSGLLDLVIAVEVTVHERHLQSALVWWLPGIIGLAGGLCILLVPHVTMCLLALVGASHALLLTAFDLSMLPDLSCHPAQRNVLLISSLLFVFFAVLLVMGALGTEEMATHAIGVYSLYFGLRLILLGGQLTFIHHSPVVVS